MTDAQVMLDLYLQAEKDVLAGKNVTFRGETVGMEDLDSIRSGRKEWQRVVSDQANGGKPYSLASFS
jgi:hypothetical protein